MSPVNKRKFSKPKAIDPIQETDPDVYKRIRIQTGKQKQGEERQLDCHQSPTDLLAFPQIKASQNDLENHGEEDQDGHQSSN